jgi:predicted enzyme related to lactoylglutathione lyase
MSTLGSIGSVVINVSDLEAEQAFWSTFLGVAVLREFPGFCWLEPQHPGGVSLALQQTPDPGAQDGRVHLDTGVADIDEAAAEIERLGGSHVEDHEIMGFTWKVMADPEGNRFCIAPAEG